MLGPQLLILLSYMLTFSVALMFVALGGMFSEHSGVINIGLEGIMVFSGFLGLFTLILLNGTPLNTFLFGKILIVIITILASMAAGILYSFLLSVAAVHFNADQTLVGTAMNLIATAIAMIFVKGFNKGSSDTLSIDPSAFKYNFGEFSFSIFLIIGIVVLIVAVFVLYKTRFGLRLRACGENPNACDSVGINVKKYRYVGVGISGALGGLGAIAYLIPTTQYWNASAGVAGFGFLALAIMIFGQWKPLRISIVSLIFSFFLAFSYTYGGVIKAITGVTLTAEMGITKELFNMIPFVACLILLIFSSKKSRAPAAEGVPYDISKR